MNFSSDWLCKHLCPLESKVSPIDPPLACPNESKKHFHQTVSRKEWRSSVRRTRSGMPRDSNEFIKLHSFATVRASACACIIREILSWTQGKVDRRIAPSKQRRNRWISNRRNHGIRATVPSRNLHSVSSFASNSFSLTFAPLSGRMQADPARYRAPWSPFLTFELTRCQRCTLFHSLYVRWKKQ